MAADYPSGFNSWSRIFGSRRRRRYSLYNWLLSYACRKHSPPIWTVREMYSGC